MSGAPKGDFASLSARADDRSMPRERTPRATSDSVATFFDELAGREPLLRKATGSARFEVVDGRQTKRWLVAIDKGTVSADIRARYPEVWLSVSVTTRAPRPGERNYPQA